VTRYAKRLRVLAACMTALAGYVDAVGYLTLSGYFVSFMSGNSTRLSIGLASGDRAVVALAGALVALFVVGVMAGTVATRRWSRHRTMVVLLVVATLLALAAVAAALGAPAAAIGLMTVAMGAENVAFERDGEVTIGITYMTGTLVKVGQRLVAAFTGGDRWAWAWNLILWLGLVGGAAVGAVTYRHVALTSLWIAAAAALVLALVARGMMPPSAPVAA
jgi:uncharacterized membrane protein YoaK (UPF0700 family)